MSENGHHHNGCCDHGTPSVQQSLDEMEFERGIWSAAQNGDLNRVQSLLDAGTPVNKLDSAGYTALHYAARSGNVDLVALLIRSGANIDAATRAGQATALHRASTAGRTGVVELLLSRNANISLKDADGKTVLHRAVQSKNYDICKRVIEKCPALVQMADNRDKLPIDYIDNSHSIYHLLKSNKI